MGYMICTFMMTSHSYFRMLLDLDVRLIRNDTSKFSKTSQSIRHALLILKYKK